MTSISSSSWLSTSLRLRRHWKNRVRLTFNYLFGCVFLGDESVRSNTALQTLSLLKSIRSANKGALSVLLTNMRRGISRILFHFDNVSHLNSAPFSACSAFPFNTSHYQCSERHGPGTLSLHTWPDCLPNHCGTLTRDLRKSEVLLSFFSVSICSSNTRMVYITARTHGGQSVTLQ